MLRSALGYKTMCRGEGRVGFMYFLIVISCSVFAQ